MSDATIRPAARTRLLSWRDAIADTALAPNTKLVAFVVSLHMNRQGASCWPGTPLLMQQASLGRSAVLAHLRQLELDGWLTATKRAGRGGPRAYTATFPRAVELALAGTLAAEPSGELDGSPEAAAAPTVREPSANHPAGRTALTREDDRPTGREASAPAAPAFDARPYIDLHQLLFPLSKPPAGRMAAVFKGLHDRVALAMPGVAAEKVTAAILARQRRYLEDVITKGGARYLSYENFAATFSEWARPGRTGRLPAAAPGTTDFADGMALLEGQA